MIAGARPGYQTVRVNSIYDLALGYEIAFSYRDVPGEIDALVRMAGREPQAVVELAAGPAEHAVECAKRGWRATAIDLSPTMRDRAQANAAAAAVSPDVIAADIPNFTAAAPVGLAL